MQRVQYIGLDVLYSECGVLCFVQHGRRILSDVGADNKGG